MYRVFISLLLCLTLSAQTPTPGASVGASGGAGGITALTGDGTASGTGSVSFTLATVNTNVGTCGDATHVGQVTLNGKGLSTACTAVAITGGGAITTLSPFTWTNTGTIAYNTTNAVGTLGTITTVASQSMSLVVNGAGSALPSGAINTLDIVNAAGTAATIALNSPGAGCGSVPMKIGGLGGGAIVLSGGSFIDTLTFWYDSNLGYCLGTFTNAFN